MSARAEDRAPAREGVGGRSSIAPVISLVAPLVASLIAALWLQGCAGSLAGGRGASAAVDAPVAPDTEQGWRDLTEGRSDQALADFDRRLSAAPRDLLAGFGRATIAFERGDGAAALERYIDVLEEAAAGEGGAWGGLLAPVAAARTGALLDDVPAAPAVRARWEDRLTGVARERLPWEARVELAALGDRVARLRGDAQLLERLARASGCAREVFQAGEAGRLPHLDLESAAPPESLRAETWRALPAAGCRVSVPPWDGRPGVQILRTAVQVVAGSYDIVVDSAGEARLRVDGGAFWRHGGETRYGPRVSRLRVALTAGRHEIEARVGTTGGTSQLGLWVLREGGQGEGVGVGVGEGGVVFVDPRGATTPAVPAKTSPTATELAAAAPAVETAAAGAEPWALVRLYAAAFVADRLGEIDRALVAGDALARRRKFAAGLVLASAIARGDPTRPSGFARDAGRTLLRAAVAVDPSLARAWNSLAAIELDAEHPRDAMDYARQASRAAPRWWQPSLALASALRARGLEWDADRALDSAAEQSGPTAGAPCAVVEALLTRAEDRRDLRAQDRLVERLSSCDSDADTRIDRLVSRGDLAGALAALRRAIVLEPDRQELRIDLSEVLLATGDLAGARAALAALVAAEPHDAPLRVRLADAQAATGDLAAARAALAVALRGRPDLSEVRRAARALGLPLPLDELRIDGKQVIREFQASHRRYAAPAVMLLDRTVHRIFADGAQLILTHNIVGVQTKDGIERWGEVTVPADAEVLMLRTHKSDGTTREPEEIAGKETVSAPDLAVGDYVEWETLESRAASDALSSGAAGGFLGERFYFQSFDSPLDRSEYILVTPAAMRLDVDSRAGAPPAQETNETATPAGVIGGAPPGETSGGGGVLRITTFAAHEMPQLFAERASVPAIEYVPSVRVSSQVSWAAWIRFLRERLYGTARSSPAIRQLAAKIGADVSADAGAGADDGAGAGGLTAAERDHRRLAAAIVRWVTDNIEAADDLRDPASQTLARGRGNRLGLVLALARELGVPAEPELARSRLLAEADGPLVPQEVDDFGDTLVRFDLGTGARSAVYSDLRLRHALFGYLPPGLDGAKTLSLVGGRFGLALSHGAADQRTVDMTIHLDERGGGSAHATEELTGWPALEWEELLDRFGTDQTKLRQDFEERWLGVQFPGAHLDELQVDMPARPASASRSRSPSPSSPSPSSSSASGGDGQVRVRYSFKSPQLGVRSDQELKLSPTFFRSQPGRRFAAESRRSTTLMLGFDVPLRLTATVVLPPSAELVAPVAARAGVIARPGAYRFFEERTAHPGAPEVLTLRRESSLPLTRVPPSEYPGVAADLRRVDGLEQQEIRIRLPGGAARGAVAP